MDQEQGIFLNGKAQLAEMLKFMTNEEKQRIIKVIRSKNPALAEELVSQSVGFETIERFSENQLLLISGFINSAIMGMALKGSNQNVQRKILSSVPKDYAKQAYQVMVKPIQRETETIQKAQNKVAHIVAGLIRQKRITL